MGMMDSFIVAYCETSKFWEAPNLQLAQASKKGNGL